MSYHNYNMPSLVRSRSTKTRGKMCTHKTSMDKKFIIITKKSKARWHKRTKCTEKGYSSSDDFVSPRVTYRTTKENPWSGQKGQEKDRYHEADVNQNGVKGNKSNNVVVAEVNTVSRMHIHVTPEMNSEVNSDDSTCFDPTIHIDKILYHLESAKAKLNKAYTEIAIIRENMFRGHGKSDLETKQLRQEEHEMSAPNALLVVPETQQDDVSIDLML